MPIGTPISDTDLELRAAPGVDDPAVGEICIRSPHIALGYLDATGSGDDRFEEDPAGRRVLRTGDLARWNAAGQLEFVGRADEAMKRRGVLIRPSRLEPVLAAPPGVREAVMAATTDTPPLVGLFYVSSVPDPRGTSVASAATWPRAFVRRSFRTSSSSCPLSR